MIKTKGYLFTPQINLRGNFMLLRKRITTVTYIFYPLTIALASVLLAYEPDRWELPVLIIAFLLLRPVMLYRDMSSPKNKYANHMVSFEIDENQISEKIDNAATTTLDWNKVDKAIKGKDYYLVVGHEQNPFYIPESAFATKEELAQFEAILESNYLLQK